MTSEEDVLPPAVTSERWKSTVMQVDMRVGTCVDMCMDMCMGMCVDMCMDMCMDMHTGMLMDHCMDMCVRIGTRIACRRTGKKSRRRHIRLYSGIADGMSIVRVWACRYSKKNRLDHGFSHAPLVGMLLAITCVSRIPAIACLLKKYRPLCS